MACAHGLFVRRQAVAQARFSEHEDTMSDANRLSVRRRTALVGWLTLPKRSALERLAEYFDSPVPSRPLI